MNTDPRFAVATSLMMYLFCMAVGAFATYVWVHGPHECSAKVRYEHVTVEYVTQCRL
jgi:hypothetical protein